MAAQKKEKGISRIDSGSTHGWFVRGYRNGKTFSRLFSDLKHGGRDQALEEARAFKADLISRLQKIPSKPRARRIVKHDSRNRSGYLGVCRTAKKSPGGKIHECYSVSWRPSPGVQKCTSFSIGKYGEEKAFQLAVEHRQRMLREIHGASAIEQLEDSPEALS